MPSVLIVDDNLLARQGLKHLLSQEHRDLVFGEAKTAAEATAQLARRRWDIVTLEVSIPGDGFGLLRDMRHSHPATRVLMISRRAEPHSAQRARQFRASGYVTKNSSRADFLRAFKHVLAGQEHFADLPPARPEGEPGTNQDGLSSRERYVLLSCASGNRIGEIAVELNLSVKTVSTFKRRVLNKLKLSSTADLVRYVIDHPTG